MKWSDGRQETSCLNEPKWERGKNSSLNRLTTTTVPRPTTPQCSIALTTVLGQKYSSDAHFTPKVADFATLPQATNFIRIHKFHCVLENL